MQSLIHLGIVKTKVDTKYSHLNIPSFAGATNIATTTFDFQLSCDGLWNSFGSVGLLQEVTWSNRNFLTEWRHHEEVGLANQKFLQGLSYYNPAGDRRLW